jgi:DNA ligase-1
MIKLLILLFSSILLAQNPHVMLLKRYKDQNITGWVMSEKFDGIRAYWDGEKLLTRKGRVIHAPKYFTKDYPTFAIDGELWSKRGDFENISSIVRDKIPDKEKWKQIKHYIFDVPDAKGDLFERLDSLRIYENNIIKIIPQIKVKDKTHLMKFLKEVESKNGEGVVVRDPKAPYIHKRTSKILKVKTFKDDECEVLGYSAGKGKYKGKVGSLVCKNGDVIFKVGSGLSNQQRENPPKIGTIITYKYKELTKYNKPRFPVFLRVRFGE